MKRQQYYQFLSKQTEQLHEQGLYKSERKITSAQATDIALDDGDMRTRLAYEHLVRIGCRTGQAVTGVHEQCCVEFSRVDISDMANQCFRKWCHAGHPLDWPGRPRWPVLEFNYLSRSRNTVSIRLSPRQG